MKELTTDIGKKYEQQAVDYLIKLNYKIIEQNFKLLPIGEIDIIKKNKNTMVFVEVKYRKSKKFGTRAEFVNKSKQNKVTRTALCYIKKNKINADIRFDVISICQNEIEHIKNAFCVDNKSYYI